MRTSAPSLRGRGLIMGSSSQAAADEDERIFGKAIPIPNLNSTKKKLPSGVANVGAKKPVQPTLQASGPTVTQEIQDEIVQVHQEVLNSYGDHFLEDDFDIRHLNSGILDPEETQLPVNDGEETQLPVNSASQIGNSVQQSPGIEVPGPWKGIDPDCILIRLKALKDQKDWGANRSSFFSTYTTWSKLLPDQRDKAFAWFKKIPSPMQGD
jgi:hypothetical protein